MKRRTVVWKAVEYEGLEYLVIDEYKGIISTNSVVISAEAQKAFRLDYYLMCHQYFVVQGVSLLLNRDMRLELHKHGQNWVDQAGKRLPEFDGCIDLDITATPFTNTLPIRRIDWQVGQSEDFKMLYITVPELTLSVSKQRYICLEKTADGGLFHFQTIEDDGLVSFEALLPVDADGLVIDYPGLFKRVWASG